MAWRDAERGCVALTRLLALLLRRGLVGWCLQCAPGAAVSWVLDSHMKLGLCTTLAQGCCED